MSLQPVSGVLETIIKIDAIDPQAARTLVKFGLYESMQDQHAAAWAEVEPQVIAKMSETLIKARTALLRNHVGKSIDADGNTADLPYAQGMAIIEEYISKSIFDLNRSQRSSRQNRDNSGRWTAGGSKREAALDLAAATMGGDDADHARRSTVLPMDERGETQSQNAHASEWNRPTEPADGHYDRQAYRRMSLTGQALSRATTPGSTPHFVGGVAQLVGDLGPEAEKVLGPGIRRTAYRYRGTERRPEKALVANVNLATQAAASIDPKTVGSHDAMIKAKTAIHNRNTLDRTAGMTDPGAVAIGYWVDHGESHDQQTLGMRSDAATLTLLKELPKKELTELSVEAGELPPSQGVIIDADGKVASQAMGFNGDHYLPFDLKNLHALHGGQYVRTRAYGGPTTEDLYTGLLSGARELTVVSNSGVFTVEFDPDMRQNRRYNDKAARMIKRYGQLLETIRTKDLYQVDVSPEDMADLKKKAWGGAGGDKNRYDTLLNTLVKQKRLESQIDAENTPEDNEYAAASRAEQTVSAKEAKTGRLSRIDRLEALTEETKKERKAIKDTQVRPLQLDGPGYGRALETLRQEFPYYIRQAKYETLPDCLRSRELQNVSQYRHFAPKDKGYVKPGQTNAIPNAAQSVSTTSFAGTTTAPVVEGVGSERVRGQVEIISGDDTDRARVATQVIDQPKKIKEAFAPESPFMNKMIDNVYKSFGLLALEATPMPVPSHWDEEKALREAPGLPYAEMMWRKISREHPGKAPEAFANWLVHEANQEQQQSVLGAMDKLKDLLGDDEQYGHGQYDTASMDAAQLEIKELIGYMHPFANEEPDKIEASPGYQDAKPQPFAEIPNTLSLEEFDTFKAAKSIENPPFGEAVERFSEEGFDIPRAIRASIAEYRQSGSKIVEDRLAAEQLAWAYLVQRDVAKKLIELGGAVSDAGPKDVQKGLRRRIIFHEVNEPFSKQVRKRLGL